MRRMIAAVDFAMAGGAGAIEDRAGLVTLSSRRVTALHVTLFTEPRYGDLEEFFMVEPGARGSGPALRH